MFKHENTEPSGSNVSGGYVLKQTRATAESAVAVNQYII